MKSLPVWIAVEPKEIQTGHFPNTSLDRYRYTNLLSGNIYLTPKSNGKGLNATFDKMCA
jgi:hypothetical protein